ncbi:type I-B CRISPR-associated protein Cas7/Csh2 [Methanobacterium congolense]|uniref:CRISPR-associated protein Cas7 n=1 Tax=Methanobacterium congolense TaxID=118062 RepID=A0A1D3L345_9EURY|nr:type I-B CRISPR-associated protein Cas7/Csh2 [Methanobacterium congolense]SCG85880.1 CRISPR-associated protein Cas7 [Methanobacterium congolense]
MSDVVKNRSEIIFLYDIENANPNGDPMDENKPRIDEETEKNIVTDVRLKRTIRDFLYKFLDEEIFIVEEINKDGTQKTRENRLEELKISSKEDGVKLLENYVDLRLFGATIAVKNMPLTWIGPVQFKFGKSLHKVEPKTIKGTSVMPSKENVTRGTFIETQILPYSLISFYGIINENAAKKTGLTELDVDLMMNGLWNGTKNIITRSKIGQMPRLLLRVVYKEDNFHIGDLDKGIKLTFNENIEEKALRNISEVKLDISGLIDKIELNKDKIERIDFKINDLETTPTLKDSFEGIKLKELMF